MKENTILFIIIGIFLLTLIFNYKEGFGGIGSGIQAVSNAVVPVSNADVLANTGTGSVLPGANTAAAGTALPGANTVAAGSVLPGANTALGGANTVAAGTSLPGANTATAGSVLPGTNTVAAGTSLGAAGTSLGGAGTDLPGTNTGTYVDDAGPAEYTGFTAFTPTPSATDPAKLSFDIAYTTATDKAIDAKDAIQLAIDSLKIGDTASADTAITNSKITVKDALDYSKDLLATASSSKVSTNITDASSLYLPLKNAYDFINKPKPSENDLQSAFDALSMLDDTTIQVLNPSNVSPKPFGDECTETKVGCQWNNDPNDISNWWTEHRENVDQLINRVQWNYHSLDVGDYIKYPWIYRNPNDRSNGTLQFDNYSRDKQNELKDLKAKMSNYDISFSSYQSILRNNSSLIDSINAEKERLKKDLSGNYPRLPITSEEYGPSGSEHSDSEPSGATCPSLKCIADFGTNVGEDLCCGQTGVLQNTEYVCPSSKPTCQNFKCGSKFGNCI